MKIEVPINGKSKLQNARDKYHKWAHSKKEAKIYRAVLFALCEGICPKCKTDMILSFSTKTENRPDLATLDHTIPLSQILEHKKYGLEIMCGSCNHKKGSKP